MDSQILLREPVTLTGKTLEIETSKYELSLRSHSLHTESFRMLIFNRSQPQRGPGRFHSVQVTRRHKRVLVTLRLMLNTQLKRSHLLMVIMILV